MIEFQCEQCSRSYKVKEEHAGRRTKCRKCGASLLVPDPAELQAEPEADWEEAEDEWDESEADWDAADDDWDESADSSDDWDDAEEETLPARRAKRKPAKKASEKKKPKEKDQPKPRAGLSKAALGGMIASGVLVVALIAWLVVGMSGVSMTREERMRARIVELELAWMRKGDPSATLAQAEERVSRVFGYIEEATPWSTLLPPGERSLVSRTSGFSREEVQEYYSDPSAPLFDRAKKLMQVADDNRAELPRLVKNTFEAVVAGEDVSELDFEIAEQLFLSKVVGDLLR